MKKQIFMRWAWCLLEYLMIFPAILMLAGFTLPGDVVLAFTIVLPFHMLAAIVITSLLKRFRNILAAGIGLIYIALVTWLWQATPMSGSAGELLMTIGATAFFFIWGIRAGIGKSVRSVFFYGGGLIVHAVCLFVFSRAPALKPLLGVLIGVSIAYVIIGLPMANRRFLVLETRQKNSVKTLPGSVLRGNKIIVISIMAGIILLSFWEALANAFVYIAGVIGKVIVMIMEFLGSLYGTGEGQPEGGGEQMMLPPAEESNSIFPVIMTILVILLFTAGLFFLIRYIVRNHKRIIAGICNFFSEFFGRFQRWGSIEQGYVDRQESLLKTEIPKKPSFFKRLFRREPVWRDMKDNRSRIRFIYARFVLEHIRKGLNFSPADTPGEAVNKIVRMTGDDPEKHSGILDAYKCVRYGEKEMDDNTVKFLKDMYIK